MLLSLRPIVTLVLLLALTGVAQAQFGGFPGGGFGGGGFGGGGFGAGGILIDAEGVVRANTIKRIPPAALKRLQQQFAEDQLPTELIVTAERRMLSLKSLEAEVKDAFENGREISPALLSLGGISRLDYVYFDRENNDVLIGGPAEGFAPAYEGGRLIGLSSGRPPLHLDDLVVALRSNAQGTRTIGCSIDPTEDNLARLQQYLRNNSTPAPSAVAADRYRQMAIVLGKQQVSIWGVPENTHFALALVDADFRMKRIALGTEPSGVRQVRSHLSLLVPEGNSLQRWWFMPLYEPLETNTDRTLFRISGQRAQLMAQEEISDAQGRRRDAAFTRQSTEKFAELFTEHFADLASISPEFAALQNLYDMALLAELIRQEARRQGITWAMSTFLEDERLPLKTYTTPKYVPSESTFRKGNRGSLIGLIGGVTVDVTGVTNNSRVTPQLNAKSIQNESGRQSLWWNATVGE